MKPGGKAALAVGAGYVLGRRHKLKAALVLGAAAATGRALRGQQGGGEQDADQQGKSGGGLLGKLGGAGKTAVVAAVTRSADQIGERLSERAAAMRQTGAGGDDK